MSHNVEANRLLLSAEPATLHPSFTAFRSQADLNLLRKWFYDGNAEGQDMRYRAVRRVRALASRGKIPHAVEMTSLLTSTVLQDECDNTDSLALQLSYSMALVRFVNGLLDPYQQGTFAIPLHALAKSIGVPNYFVEVRHMSTHESLPTLAILRVAGSRALAWLLDSYWTNIDEYDHSDTQRVAAAPVRDGVGEALGKDAESRYIQSIGGQIQHKLKSSLICDNLELYKKVLKANVDKDLPLIAKKGVSGSILKFTNAIEKISQTCSMPPFLGDNHRTDFSLFSGTDLVINVLLYKNFMLYNKEKALGKEKFNVMLLRLYEPLLNHLGPAFKAKVFACICESLAQYCVAENKKTVRSRTTDLVGFLVQCEYEALELMEWAGYLLVGADGDDSEEAYSQRPLITQLLNLNDRCKLPDACIKSLLKNLKKCTATNQSTKALEERLANTANSEAFKAPPSLEELLNRSLEIGHGTGEPKFKRQKKSLNFFLEEQSNYKTTPFGIIP